MAEKSEQIEENLVKKTCRELGITQKELAEIFYVTPHTITNWVRGKMEETHKIALKGLIYKKRLEDIQKKIINVNLDNI
jgi:DNA-binding XRE family transcriptional regulator